MSFFDRLFGKRSGNAAPAAKILLADVMSIGGGSNRLPPKVQIDILHSLSRYSEKEKITVHAMLTGEPLRSVPENESFRNVQVSYAASVQELPALAAKLAKRYGRKGVVAVTSNRSVEDDVRQAGAALLRASTFKKALSGNGGQGDSDSRNPSQDRHRRNRNRPRRERQQAPAAEPEQKPAEKAPEKKPDDGGISDLIDLV